MREKLREEYVKKLPFAKRKAGEKTTASYVEFDGAGGIPGFGVRVTEQSKSFILNYSLYGKQDRITIGRFGEHSAESARLRAQVLRQKLREGIDPVAELKALEAAALGEKTFGELAAEYLKNWSDTNKRPRSAREDHDMINNHLLPRFGDMRVTAIDQQDVERMMQEMKAKGKPVRANRCRALMSHMYTKAVQWKWVLPATAKTKSGEPWEPPTKHVQKFDEEPKQRWLTVEELQRVEQALKKFEKRREGNHRSANVIRLLIETGSRLAEVLRSEWPQFDMKRRTWLKPAAMVKGKEDVYVPLSEAAIAVLKKMKPRETGFVFPSFDNPKEAQTSVKWAWAQVQELAGLSGIRLHDLRHTFASHLVSSGVSLYVVKTLLGHKQMSTTERYAHLADAPQRTAVNAFGQRGVKKKAAR